MFWAKTRMGWKETNGQEHTGADGKPIAHSVEIKVTFDRLTHNSQLRLSFYLSHAAIKFYMVAGVPGKSGNG